MIPIRPRLVALSLFAFLLAGSGAAHAKEVYLSDVLDSVRIHHPEVAAANAKVRASQGKLLSTRGAFDLYLKGKIGQDAIGFYDRRQAGVSLLQSTPIWGAQLEGGYRVGEDFPPYEGKGVTDSLGEVFFGLRLPILRDGYIDENRFAIAAAEWSLTAQEWMLAQKLLQLSQKASDAYWDWVQAGVKLRVAQQLRDLAQQRREAIRRRVDSGDTAEIDFIDNERLVLSRQEAVITVRRKVAEKAIKLSLYLRNESGAPRVPAESELPLMPNREEQAHPASAQETIEIALEKRPEMQVMDLQTRILNRQLDLNKNQRLPQLDFVLRVSQDVGNTQSYGPSTSFESKDETEIHALIDAAWPVQQRKARGASQIARAELAQVDQIARWARDQISAEVKDAWIALDTSWQRIELSRKALAMTLRVEQAEKRRFELGQSTILLVNLREEYSAKARLELADAQADYERARVTFLTASAQLQPEQ